MSQMKPCSACGKMTDKFLFSDKTLNIVVCSKKCEYEYLNTLSPNTKEQTNLLQSIDVKIEKNRLNERISWIVTGFGLVMVALGFLTSRTSVFIVGLFPLAVGAFSTSFFENRRNRLVQLRKRIII